MFVRPLTLIRNFINNFVNGVVWFCGWLNKKIKIKK